MKPNIEPNINNFWTGLLVIEGKITDEICVAGDNYESPVKELQFVRSIRKIIEAFRQQDVIKEIDFLLQQKEIA